jgi:hypothetical protein
MTEQLTFPPRWQQRPPAGTGSPLTAPFEVSVTELNTFQRCRRNWDETSPSRKSLHLKGVPSVALNVGSAMHYAVAAQTLGQDPEQAIREFYSASRAKIEFDYRNQVGTGLSDEELDSLDAQRMMCLQLIRAYYARYGLKNPVRPYRSIACEVTFRIPLDEWLGIYLIGTIDQVVVDESDCPIPVETKTYSRKPNKTDWRFAHQPYGYAAALQYLTGQRVPYFLYNGIRKTGPTQPKILKRGGVSQRWIDTTYEVYRDAVRLEHGGKIPNSYLDILNRFKARDNSPENAFTTRFRMPVSQHAIELWLDQAAAIAREMAFSPIIYPNFPWNGCRFCRTQDLCHALQAGDDAQYQYLVNENYRIDTTHTRKAKHIATRKNVRNVEDLAAFARNQELLPPVIEDSNAETLEED